ncbi:MAG: nucleotidyltransferase family protein [Leucobacter sp.]
MSSFALTPTAVLAERRSELLRVLKQFGVIRAGLFGSTARGTDHVGSDLDLVVEFGPETDRDLIRLSESLSRAAGVHVDVVDVERVYQRAAETGIGATILRDTVLL